MKVEGQHYSLQAPVYALIFAADTVDRATISAAKNENETPKESSSSNTLGRTVT